MSYLLLMSDEDGEPCKFLNEIDQLLERPEDHGIERFLSEIPDKDPMYWNEGDALLLKVDVLVPRAVTKGWKL